MMTLRTLRLAGLLLLLAPFACECQPGPGDAGPDGSGGVLVARAVGGGFELSLEDLDAPLRTLQVGVTLTGTRATALSAAGVVAHDVLEAGLDQPKESFTAVVADTRRLLLTEGAIARIDTEGAGQIQLRSALAIDDEGQRAALALEVR